MHAITKQLTATANRLNQFHSETAHDEELSLLKHIVQCGWPQHIHEVQKEIQPYWTFREQLTIENGNSTERKSYYSATQLTSRDDPAPTHWTPWVRQMSQQSQTVNVLAWTVQRIKRTANKLYYMFEIQLKKAKLCIHKTTCQT